MHASSEFILKLCFANNIWRNNYVLAATNYANTPDILISLMVATLAKVSFILTKFEFDMGDKSLQVKIPGGICAPYCPKLTSELAKPVGE